MAICETCEFYGMPDAKINWMGDKRCQKCSCYMPMKTTLAKAWCPENKWHAHTKEQESQTLNQT